jgi:transcriptional regulator with XRE-family HTH domain
MREMIERDQEMPIPSAERTRGIRRRIGARIAGLRRERGWSRDELADLLVVPPSRLGKWERGGSALPPEDLVALAEILGVTFDELLTGNRLVLSPEMREKLVESLSAILDFLK